MRSVALLAGGLFLLQLVGLVFGGIDGVCVLRSTEYGAKYGISGTVRFIFNPATTKFRVTANIQGNKEFEQKSDAYGMHVHTYGDMSDLAAGTSAGLHWVPSGGYAQHGCPDSDKRHGGDMGNWTQAAGKIAQTKELDLLEMNQQKSILGRSVVLHEHFDDCTGQTGESGNRIAFCVIGLTNEDFNYATANEQLDGSTGICVMQPTDNCKKCAGKVVLRAKDLTALEITGQFSGIKGVHGFHLKAYGDLRSDKGDFLGDDYNPFGRDHGLPPFLPRHLGDFGNIQSYDPKTGDAWYDFADTYVPTLSNVLGRALVVYADPDNGAGKHCSDTGGAGDILMQCVVGLMSHDTAPLVVPKDVKINNVYKTKSCPLKDEENAEDAEAGLIAGLVFGWCLVGILLVIILGIFGYMLWVKKHGQGFQVLSAPEGRTYGSEL